MARDKVIRNVVDLCSVPEGWAGRRSKALTLDQASAVLDAAAGTRMVAYIVVSLLTGARTEEMRALSWDHLDLVGRPDHDPPACRRWRPSAPSGRWVLRLKEDGVGPPTISKCKLILDAIFTTALNDQITVLHPGRGVKTPRLFRSLGRSSWRSSSTASTPSFPKGSGKAFAAFVQDVFSRRIVGWAVADHHLTELPLAALEMALYARARTGQDVRDVVHHSDAGAEYTAIRYRNVLADFGALASIGTVGDSLLTG